ncbi:MAG: helix-turn-helix domain-containing protein [Chitinispirillaceae bacterium]|nr:helix-turn-helix domain-containing protein [Chitinispirillaceae bacterium]
MIQKIFIFLISFSVVICSSNNKQSDITSKLIYLSTQKDSNKIDFSIINTNDSAYFKEPKIREILYKGVATVELVPLCNVDSIYLYVNHSGGRVDTIARLFSSPYKTQWHYTSLPDQDQVHLQFGYIIFHPTGKSIASKPLPHRWVIDRNRKKSKNKYHCKQLLPPDSICIDGKLDEWKHIKRKKIDKGGFFALQWDGLYLYFAADIRSYKVISSDFVELHLDSYFTRESFADERCRSIRFSPKGRTFCIVSSKKDSINYSQNDSITVLLLEGIKSRITLGDSGYVVEAAIPFYALSSLDFPKQKIGMDISVMYSDSSNLFYGWTNKNRFSRYNPSEWGILVLHQAFFAVRFFLMIASIILGLVIILIGSTMVIHFFRTQKYEKEERKGGSDEFLAIEEAIEKMISEPQLTPAKISKEIGLSEDVICKVIKDETDSTFEQFVTNKRVSIAKKKLWDLSISFEEIAKECGFTSQDNMKEIFLSLLKTSPDDFRKRVKEFYEEE